MLAKLNERILQEFVETGIDFARSFSRTSNLFCTRYYVWIKKNRIQILMAHCILQKLKKEVNYDDSLYSTGILMNQDDLKKLQQMLGGKFRIENDSDLMNLVENKGEKLLDKIQKGMKTA